MSCVASNPEELKSLVENHKAVFNIKPGQTQEDTIKFLNYLQDNFEKKDGRYVVKGSVIGMQDTVTGRIGKWWERKNPNPPSEEVKKIINQKAEVGNFIHDINELFGNLILDYIKDKSTDEFFKTSIKFEDLKYEEGLKKIKELYGYDISPVEYVKIFEGVYENIRDVYKRQKAINTRTGNSEGKPYIVFEQILIDPKDNLGGTADFVAIFSDNTGVVLDYKTKIPRKDQIGSDGKLKSDSWKLSVMDKQRYKMQLTSLSKILKQRLGVQKVVTAPIHFIKVQLPWDKTKNQYVKKVVGISHGQKQENVLQQLRPLSESTGFADLDKFLQHVDKKIREYENKSDKTTRQYYQDKINELEQAKRDILTNHNFNTILKYGQKLETELTSDKIEKMSISDLKDHIDELKMMMMLADSTYEYRNYVKQVAPNKQSDIDKLKADMALMYTELGDKLNGLQDQLYNKKIIALVENTTDSKITDDSGRLLPFNDEGFFGKYFNQLSQFENPVFKTFRALLDSSQYDTKESVEKVIHDVQQKEDALYSWMKQNGKSRQWFIDTFIDKETDNLVSKLSKEFTSKLKEIKTSKNFDLIKENYEPNDGYQEWYTKTLALSKDKNQFKKQFELSKDNKEAWIKALYDNRLKLKESVQAKNLNPKYQYIQANKPLADYYNMIVKWNKEFRQILGVDYFQLPNNFLPNIRKSTVERIQDLGAIAGTKQTINNLIEDLNVREDDMMYGETEDGKLVRRIPRFFINPFKDSDDNLLIGEKSYEVGKSLVLFAKMAYNFKNMQKIEAEVTGLREFMVERGEEFITKRGKHLEDYVGNKLTENMQDTSKIFDTFVDMYLYGINIQPSIGDKSGDWEKRILTAKQYFSMKSLGLGFVPATGGFLAAKVNAIIEGNKGVIYNKQQYNQAIKDSWSDRGKFLALNAFFDPMGSHYENFSTSEVKYGTKQTGVAHERNWIAKYVNSRILLRPFAAGDEYIDEVITTAMAKNYYIDELGNLKRMRNQEDIDKYSDRSVWNLFSFENNEAKLKIPEEQLKQVMISFRRAVQSGQSKIKGTIPQEDKAYWQSQIMGQVIMHFKSWMPGIIRERVGNLKYNSAIQAVEIGRYRAVGIEFSNVEKLETIEYLKQTLPTKLLQFAKHLFLLGKGGKLNDIATKQMFFENWLDENPHYKGKMTFEDFMDIQQKQVKALMIELRVLLTFAALLMLMGGDWDDDGEKDYKQYWITRKLASVMFKTNQELGFVYNPNEFASMVRTPIPMIGILTDASKVISNGFDELRDVVFEENSKTDKTPFGYYSTKMIPGANQFVKFLDFFNNDSGDQYK